jgi:HAD superfamily hydrolase (TIGR01490 family)
MTGIDFFDVDHTLTRRSSGGRFVSLAMKRKLLPLHLLFVIPWYSMTYKLGFFRLRRYDDGFPYLKGIPRAALEGIAKESFETRLKGDLFEGAVMLVKERHAQGRRVILATSSIDFIVAPLAEHLGVRDILATTLEFDHDACTGRVAGLPMFRREKKERVLAFLAAEGVAPKDCSFYSDSIYDLPLLEEVGRPIAVNPDFRLRKIAHERGWSVIDLA